MKWYWVVLIIIGIISLVSILLIVGAGYGISKVVEKEFKSSDNSISDYLPSNYLPPNYLINGAPQFPSLCKDGKSYGYNC